MIITFNGKTPKISNSCFIAENSTTVGDVIIGENSSVWFGAVIRGDENTIIIGEGTSIQDNAVLHNDPQYALTIGSNVTIGHGAIVHGATVGDNVLIGMGAIVMNGAQIGENSVIGAGAVVTENAVIPHGSVVVGVPGKIVKNSEETNSAMNALNSEAYIAIAEEYKNQI